MAIDVADIKLIPELEIGRNLPIRGLFRVILERWSVIPPAKRPTIVNDFPLDVDRYPTSLEHLSVIQKHILALGPFFLNMDEQENRKVGFEPIFYTPEEMVRDEEGRDIFILPVHCSGHGTGTTSGPTLYVNFIYAAVYWLKHFRYTAAVSRVDLGALGGSVLYEDADPNDQRALIRDPTAYGYDTFGRPLLRIEKLDGSYTESRGGTSSIEEIFENTGTYENTEGERSEFDTAPIVFSSQARAQIHRYYWQPDGSPGQSETGFWTHLSCSYTNLPTRIEIVNAASYIAEPALVFSAKSGLRHYYKPHRRPWPDHYVGSRIFPSEQFAGYRMMILPRTETIQMGRPSSRDWWSSYEETMEVNGRWLPTWIFPWQSLVLEDSGWRGLGTVTDYTFDGYQSFVFPYEKNGEYYGPIGRVDSNDGYLHWDIGVSGVYISRKNFFDSFGLVPKTNPDSPSESPVPVIKLEPMQPHTSEKFLFAGQGPMPRKPDCDPVKLLSEARSELPNWGDLDDSCQVEIEASTTILPILDYGDVYKISDDDKPENWLGIDDEVWQDAHRDDSSGTESSGT